MAFQLTPELREQFTKAGGAELDEVLARQGSLTEQQQFQNVLRKYAGGANPTSLQFTHPVLGLRNLGDFLEQKTPKDIQAGLELGGSFIFPQQEQQFQTGLEQAKNIFTQQTGLNLSGDQLDVVTQHLRGGDTVEQALSNLGRLDWLAKNLTLGGENISERMTRTGETRQDIEHFLGTQGVARQFVNQLPQPSQTITPDQMAATQGIDVPGLTPDMDTTGLADGMVEGAQTQIGQIIQQLTPPETEADKKQQSLLDDMASLTGDLAQKAADQLTQEQAAGLPQLRQQFADINAEILAKTAEYKQLQVANQNKPITMSSIIGRDRAIQNAMAADIGLLQAQALGLQGRIETAQNTVNRAIGLKYSTIESQLNVYQAQLNALQPILNKEEKKQALAQQLILDQRKQALAEKKEEEQNKANYILGLMTKYPDAGIGFEDSAADAQIKITSSKIYQDQIRLLGGKANTTGSGTPWTPVTPTPTTTTTPTTPEQTFEEYLSEKEFEAGQSFTQERRDQLRQEFEAQRSIPTPQAQVADLSQYNYDFAVQEVIQGRGNASALLTGGTAKERQRYQEQLEDAQRRGLLRPAPTEKQKQVFNSIVDKYNRSPLILASDRTIVLEDTIENIRKNPGDAAQQLNLVYSYVQALDTYQSAVREGELGLVNSIDSAIGRLQKSVDQIREGKVVRDDVALQIANAADLVVKTIKKGASNKEKAFASQAKVNGIEDLWNDYRTGFDAAFDAQQSTITNATGYTASGVAYEILP